MNTEAKYKSETVWFTIVPLTFFVAFLFAMFLSYIYIPRILIDAKVIVDGDETYYMVTDEEYTKLSHLNDICRENKVLNQIVRDLKSALAQEQIYDRYILPELEERENTLPNFNRSREKKENFDF